MHDGYLMHASRGVINDLGEFLNLVSGPHYAEMTACVNNPFEWGVVMSPCAFGNL